MPHETAAITRARTMDLPTLTVHEIFSSLQGETTEAGRPCTFVRLTACDLRCTWCDTPHAFTGGTKRTIESIVDEVRERGIPFVTVTGGEPLLQPQAGPLVTALADAGFEVQVETGGHRDISVVDPRARVILDLKAPGSGEAHRMDWANVARLRPHDQVKLVIADRADYDWALGVLRERLVDFRGVVLVQPVTGVQDPAQLAEWVVADKLPVRFTIQLHALLWPGRTGV
jgi:7-carboxy-7-deazaguanine synthase